MKKNIGTSGRVIRFILAILILLFAYWQMSWLALIAGLFVLFEAAMSWCVVNQFLGKNECSTKK
jgi:ABC-type transport system involved in multi-copper enzyme maturation permease subunit